MLTNKTINIFAIKQDRPQVKQAWFIIDAPMFVNKMFIRLKDSINLFYIYKFLTIKVT